jgi:hypothetical protein
MQRKSFSPVPWEEAESPVSFSEGDEVMRHDEMLMSKGKPHRNGKRLQKSLALFAVGLLIQVAVLSLSIKTKATNEPTGPLRVSLKAPSLIQQGKPFSATVIISYTGELPASGFASHFIAFPPGSMPGLEPGENPPEGWVFNSGPTFAGFDKEFMVYPGRTLVDQVPWTAAITGTHRLEVGAFVFDGELSYQDGAYIDVVVTDEVGLRPDIGILAYTTGLTAAVEVANTSTVVIGNSGTLTDTAVYTHTAVSDPPGIVTYTLISPSQGEILVDPVDPLTFKWDVGDVSPGISTTLTVKWKTLEPGSVQWFGQAAGRLSDVNPGNNITGTATTVLPIYFERSAPEFVLSVPFVLTHTIENSGGDPVRVKVEGNLETYPEQSAIYLPIILRSLGSCQIISPTAWECGIDLDGFDMATIQTPIFSDPAQVIQTVRVSQGDATLAVFTDTTAVEVAAPLCDFDGDGECDANDINLFRNHFMAGRQEADVNGDGVINARDINDFRNVYIAAQR